MPSQNSGATLIYIYFLNEIAYLLKRKCMVLQFHTFDYLQTIKVKVVTTCVAKKNTFQTTMIHNNSIYEGTFLLLQQLFQVKLKYTT